MGLGLSLMVVHVVLFKWKEDVTSDAIAAAVKALQALKDQIPGILEITCGRNFSERSQGFQQGLVVKFVDQAALEAYLPHPEHQAVVQNLIKPILADILALDYEV